MLAKNACSKRTSHPNCIRLLPDDISFASQAVVDRLENKADWYWDQFYRIHADKFFKDRHYLDREFPDLAPTAAALAEKDDDTLEVEDGEEGGDKETSHQALDSAVAALDINSSGRPLTYLELGCGVGNTLFPAIRRNPNLRAFACDFAASAIDIVRAHPDYVSLNAPPAVRDSVPFPPPSPPPSPPHGSIGSAVSSEAQSAPKVFAFVADITSFPLTRHILPYSVDVATMIFVLSAVSRGAMASAIRNVAAVLRPGSGKLLFRDYCMGDLAQKRLEVRGGRQLGERFFARGDGTRCFYFLEQELREMFEQEGFRCDELLTHERQIVNHKRGVTMDRKWVQAVFTHVGGGGSRGGGGRGGGVREAEKEEKEDSGERRKSEGNDEREKKSEREKEQVKVKNKKEEGQADKTDDVSATSLAPEDKLCKTRAPFLPLSPLHCSPAVTRVLEVEKAFSACPSDAFTWRKGTVTRHIAIRLGSIGDGAGNGGGGDASTAAAATAAAEVAAAEVVTLTKGGAKLVVAADTRRSRGGGVANREGLYLLAEELKRRAWQFMIERVRLLPLDCEAEKKSNGSSELSGEGGRKRGGDEGGGGERSNEGGEGKEGERQTGQINKERDREVDDVVITIARDSVTALRKVAQSFAWTDASMTSSSMSTAATAIKSRISPTPFSTESPSPPSLSLVTSALPSPSEIRYCVLLYAVLGTERGGGGLREKEIQQIASQMVWEMIPLTRAKGKEGPLKELKDEEDVESNEDNRDIEVYLMIVHLENEKIETAVGNAADESFGDNRRWKVVNEQGENIDPWVAALKRQLKGSLAGTSRCVQGKDAEVNEELNVGNSQLGGGNIKIFRMK